MRGDPVSTHTLAGAAHRILTDLSKVSEEKPETLLRDIQAYVKPEHRKEMVDKLRSAQHAERDHGDVYTFNALFTEFLLFDSVRIYRRLTGEDSPVMGTYWLRAAVTWAQDTIVAAQQIPESGRLEFSQMSKREFFATILPVAHESALGR